jgi:hypothetical protein
MSNAITEEIDPDSAGFVNGLPADRSAGKRLGDPIAIG